MTNNNIFRIFNPQGSSTSYSLPKCNKFADVCFAYQLLRRTVYRNAAPRSGRPNSKAGKPLHDVFHGPIASNMDAYRKLTNRTYRERKEAYTKSLEREVAQSKQREAALRRENEQLQQTIQSLVGKLGKLGVNSPSDTAMLSPLGWKQSATGSPGSEIMADSMSSPAPPQARLGDIDPVALGVDFVLA
jgi:hypothetical protein